MSLTVIGLNHDTATVTVRERLAFPSATLPDALISLSTQTLISEVMILSTCNRTEIYCIGDASSVLSWLADYQHLDLTEFASSLYQYKDELAVQHAFRVACGLDSMVLGEPQILGQLKKAVHTAQCQHTLGRKLAALFQKTFAAAKEIRTISAVGENSVSMAAAAVKLANQIFPDISALNVLLIGAGEMIELVAPYFAAEHPQHLTILNRTLRRANEICHKLGNSAKAHLLSKLPDILAEYDIVISSTASPFPVIGKDLVEQVLKKRRGMPMFFLDLAIPRDIEAQVCELDDAYLHTVDDLVSIIQHGQDARKQAATVAEQMIAEKVRQYINWQQSSHIVPLIRKLQEQGELNRQRILAKAQRRLRKGMPVEDVLNRLSHELTNALLHEPKRSLNKDGQLNPELVSAISHIYHLEQ